MQPLLFPPCAFFRGEVSLDKNLESGNTNTPIAHLHLNKLAKWELVLTALCCVASLYPARIHDMVLSAIATLALLTVMLIQSRSANHPVSSDSHSAMFGTLKPLALRIIATLCCVIALQTAFFGHSPVSILSVALLGSVKAFSWYCILILVSPRCFLPRPVCQYAHNV